MQTIVLYYRSWEDIWRLSVRHWAHSNTLWHTPPHRHHLSTCTLHTVAHFGTHCHTSPTGAHCTLHTVAYTATPASLVNLHTTHCGTLWHTLPHQPHWSTLHTFAHTATKASLKHTAHCTPSHTLETLAPLEHTAHCTLSHTLAHTGPYWSTLYTSLEHTAHCGTHCHTNPTGAHCKLHIAHRATLWPTSPH